MTTKLGFRIDANRAVTFSIVSADELPGNAPCVFDGKWVEREDLIGMGFRGILDLLFGEGEELPLTDLATKAVLARKYELAFQDTLNKHEKNELRALTKRTGNMDMLSTIEDDDYRQYMLNHYKQDLPVQDLQSQIDELREAVSRLQSQNMVFGVR